MSTRIHTIDRHPDTVLILKRPTTDFAIWERLGDEIDSPEDDVEIGDIKAESPEIEIHYLVSSRHLMLASPRFYTMLADSNWVEGHRSDDGRYHINVEDWDEQALLVILNIFHLRHKEVPRELELEVLAKIAVLVDYYECAEVLELFSDMWIEKLRKDVMVPLIYCRDLMLWLCVALVFRLSEEFKTATLVAIRWAPGPIGSLGLPISPSTVHKLDRRRNTAIELIMATLDLWLENYQSPEYKCRVTKYNFECGAYFLGALTKGMYNTQLYPLRHVAPFEGLSFEALYAKVRGIVAMPRSLVETWDHSCSLEETVGKAVEDLAQIDGLAIDQCSGFEDGDGLA
ncbi:hypothetical protein P154DRAFT_496699 [Amniculicola lignicola CBS 123094]|uniref:BTB domain-containing protein n=1 Tax=Amniculicola lignicola CBS 123094 TaxID=1392246 RepID=A0A6A5W6H8_9PLEO|nr:hypothetical protein P154DRAFT_496699 [Amniculicola lignicola CBS 123094]